MKKFSTSLFIAIVFTSAMHSMETAENDESITKKKPLFTITNITEHDELDKSLKNSRQNIVVMGMAATSGISGVGLITASAVHVAQTSKKKENFTIDSTAVTYFVSGLCLTAAGYFGISLHDKLDNVLKKQ